MKLKISIFIREVRKIILCLLFLSYFNYPKINAGESAVTIIILDQSSSMIDNDEDKYSIDGVQLALALGGFNTRLAVVTFAGEAMILSKLLLLRNVNTRYKIQKKINNSTYSYTGTNFRSAFKIATKVLDAAPNATYKSILFMTDGNDDNLKLVKKRLAPYVEKMIKNKYRIFCINFTQKTSEIQLDLLQNISRKSSGFFFDIKKPSDLVDTFLNISQDIESFLTYEGSFEPVFVFPGTKRLVYIAVKETRKSELRIESLKINGTVFKDKSKIYNYPKSNKKKNLVLLTVDFPPTGVWETEVSGNMRKGYIMVQPPFKFDYVPGLPGPEYSDKDRINIAIDMKGDQGVDMEQYIGITSFKTVLKSLNTGKLAGETVLKPGFVTSKNILRYSGGIIVKLTNPEQKETFSVISYLTITNTYKNKTYRWNNKKTILISVSPADTTSLKFNPPFKDFGTIWSDDIDKIRGVTELSFIKTGTLDIRIFSNFGLLKVSPIKASLSTGNPIKIAYKMEKNKVLGSQLSEDNIIARAKTPSTIFKGNFSVKVNIVPWEISKALDLTPGYSRSKNELNFKDTTIYPEEIQWGISELKGKAGIIIVETKMLDGKLQISGKIDKKIPDGRFSGLIFATIKGSSIKKTREVFLNIKTPEPGLNFNNGADITININAGEEKTAKISVKLLEVKEAEIQSFEMTKMLSSTGKSLIPGIDFEIKSGANWDGKKLNSLDQHHFQIILASSSDASSDVFKGKIIVSLKSGTKTKKVQVPVTINLKE